MSLARDVADALDECERDHWQCATCDAPAAEGSKHCRSCDSYWNETVPWMNSLDYDRPTPSVSGGGEKNGR